MEKAVYSIPEVASLLDVNLTRAYELARQRGFPAIRIGRRIVVPRAAFWKWLDTQSCGISEGQE
ncbi:MAG: helix-turn-helix domain-containing protein [Thermacetogeniaceae bacterium]